MRLPHCVCVCVCVCVLCVYVCVCVCMRDVKCMFNVQYEIYV
jgi:hypothetical protein